MPPFKKKPWVRLSGGKGSKSRYNERLAQVIHKRRGGWVTVKVPHNGSGENSSTCTETTIKWRSNAWTNTEVLPILKLPDNCLVKIFSFIGAGDNPPEAFDESDISPELVDKKRLSPTSVEPTASLKGAVRFHQALSAVCLRFRGIVQASFGDIVGLVDVDLDVFSVRCIPWLVKHSIHLRSVKLTHGFLEDGAALLYLLNHGDASRLTTLVTVLGENNLRFFASLVQQAWYKQRSGRVIDLTDRNLQVHPPSVPILLRDLGFSLPVTEIVSWSHLADEISALCPKLCRLKIHGLLDPSTGLVPIPRRNSLLSLNLVILDRQANRVVSEVLEQLPKLIWFKVSFSGRQYLVDSQFHIKSDSLRYLDFSDAEKGCWITRCQCSSLRYLVCRKYNYGNGVRVRDNEIDELDMNAQGIFRAGDTRFDGVLGDVTFEPLAVPDSCQVYIGGSWSSWY
jgi:hypothetical protein